MKVLIATSRGPGNNFDAICASLRKSASDNGLKLIGGIIWTNGIGCTNLCFEIKGDKKEREKMANGITMALMPAKWSTTHDLLPHLDTNETISNSSFE